MFDRHRRDLKEAHAETIKQMERIIIILTDEVDYLRYKLGQPPVQRPVVDAVEDAQPRKMWLSEEEEDILAMQMNDLLNSEDMKRIESTLGAPLTLVNELEPDE